MKEEKSAYLSVGEHEQTGQVVEAERFVHKVFGVASITFVFTIVVVVAVAVVAGNRQAGNVDQMAVDNGHGRGWLVVKKRFMDIIKHKLH